MDLTILTPTKKTVFRISWIEIDTPSGNFVIQTGHIPTFIPLSKSSNAIIQLQTGKLELIPITSGIIEITRTSAILLLES